MTPEDLGRSRLAALTDATDAGRLGAELLDGARARADQARLLAERGVAGERPARRWSVTWRAAVTAATALAVVVAVVVLRALPAPPEVLVSTAPASSAGTVADLPDAAATTGTAVLTVHVVGAVQRPGVVTVPAGSRAVDAVAAAGGAGEDADLAAVNLARPLADGEQVLVPRVGEPSTGGGATGGALDLNGADAAALEALPRIGPVLAERIVAWRAEHGRFSSVDELAEVPGIGPALLAALEGLVRV